MPLTGDQVAEHDDAKSCWVIIHGKAYDVTDFLPEHPGGQKIILKYAGKDATDEFDPIHPPDTLDKYLHSSKHLGPVDMDTVAAEAKDDDPDEEARQERIAQRPLLEQCYNLFDFEAVARRVMKRTAWAYYSSAADDEITMRENHAALHRIWFRPQVLVDVEKIDLSTTMLGTKCDVPFYVTATALGKLGHPEGEVVLTRAARTHGVIQMIPTLASCSFDEIVDARQGDQVQWLQLYVNKDRDITKRIVQHAERRGCRGLFITVDAPQLGRREKDMRSKFTDPGSDVQAGHETDKSQGAARAISSFIDPSLSWRDIPWFQSITNMPIVLKGVQRVEDVVRAAEVGVQGVVLSNHGGRQLDFARSGIEVLAEAVPALRERLRPARRRARHAAAQGRDGNEHAPRRLRQRARPAPWARRRQGARRPHEPDAARCPLGHRLRPARRPAAAARRKGKAVREGVGSRVDGSQRNLAWLKSDNM
ncbi:hypothetical protein HIM_02700 [Hirsutella minnesotensis 3608]|nr:hypothetical protein HIM_02700 [Hirsutella minnesotensis 3608]